MPLIDQLVIVIKVNFAFVWVQLSCEARASRRDNERNDKQRVINCSTRLYLSGEVRSGARQYYRLRVTLSKLSVHIPCCNIPKERKREREREGRGVEYRVYATPVSWWSGWHFPPNTLPWISWLLYHRGHMAQRFIYFFNTSKIQQVRFKVFPFFRLTIC